MKLPWVESVLVVLDKWSSYRGDPLNRFGWFDCMYINLYIIFVFVCVSLSFPGNFNWITVCVVYNLVIYIYVCMWQHKRMLFCFIFLKVVATSSWMETWKASLAISAAQVKLALISSSWSKTRLLLYFHHQFNLTLRLFMFH